MFLSRDSFHENGTLPTSGEIFVFGSNLAGRHGKGAALIAAKRFGAVYGVGSGITGQCYAIPTKDEDLHTLSLEAIAVYAKTFCQYTHAHPDKRFFVSAVGCGLAGYKPSEIGSLFSECHTNCTFAHTWYGHV